LRLAAEPEFLLQVLSAIKMKRPNRGRAWTNSIAPAM